MKPHEPIRVQTGVWTVDPKKKRISIRPGVSPLESIDLRFDSCRYDPTLYPNPKNGDPITVEMYQDELKTSWYIRRVDWPGKIFRESLSFKEHSTRAVSDDGMVPEGISRRA